MPFQIARNEQKQCAECGKIATFYCKNEDFFFCNECDLNWHMFDDHKTQKDGDNYKDHMRFDLTELESLADNLQKDYGSCEYHNHRAYEFYCITCREALCP